MKTIFAVYKPSGISSHVVVNKVRRLTGVKRVGHGGTLDPLAEGVLVIAVGRENTKKLSEFVKGDKEYLATIKLGMTSTTDDEEGEKTVIIPDHIPASKEVESIIKLFQGDLQQIPPNYSAMLVGGIRAYHLARQREKSGEKFSLEPRTVQVKEMEVLKYDYPLLGVRIVTGPGFYVRSFARDIGEKLKAGGYLFHLERTRVGKFTKVDAIPFEELEKYISA